MSEIESRITQTEETGTGGGAGSGSWDMLGEFVEELTSTSYLQKDRDRARTAIVSPDVVAIPSDRPQPDSNYTTLWDISRRARVAFDNA